MTRKQRIRTTYYVAYTVILPINKHGHALHAVLEHCYTQTSASAS